MVGYTMDTHCFYVHYNLFFLIATFYALKLFVAHISFSRVKKKNERKKKRRMNGKKWEMYIHKKICWSDNITGNAAQCHRNKTRSNSDQATATNHHTTPSPPPPHNHPLLMREWLNISLFVFIETPDKVRMKKKRTYERKKANNSEVLLIVFFFIFVLFGLVWCCFCFSFENKKIRRKGFKFRRWWSLPKSCKQFAFFHLSFLYSADWVTRANSCVQTARKR